MTVLLNRREVLREDAEDLIEEHHRLVRELNDGVMDARIDGNHHVADMLVEQSDLHFRTATTLEHLLDEL